MDAHRQSRKKRACIFVPVGVVAFLILVIAAFVLSNVNLPQHSANPNQLSELEKSRLSEAIRLRKALGDGTWPGWSQAVIPIILYNEKYAFLVGYPTPPAGWSKVPNMQQRGGPWEVVPGDLFENQPYYRTPIANLDETPQAFTVLVGDKWVASFQTREFSQVSFYQGFQKEFPPFISPLIPVRLVWTLMMGKTESYIGALEHESFHAFQGFLAQSTLARAESQYSILDSYPFDSEQQAWFDEMDLLVQAAEAKTDERALDLARQFLQLRDARRKDLSPAQANAEQLREWEEGLAKYAELEATHLAGSVDSYTPVQGLSQDKDFHNYDHQQQWWAQQLREAKNQNLSGDTRFYYSGNALAVLLDRLFPGWKTRAVPGGEFLDDLLKEVVGLASF